VGIGIGRITARIGGLLGGGGACEGRPDNDFYLLPLHSSRGHLLLTAACICVTLLSE